MACTRIQPTVCQAVQSPESTTYRGPVAGFPISGGVTGMQRKPTRTLKTSWLLPGPEAPSNPGERPPRSPGTGFHQARPEDFIEPAPVGAGSFFLQPDGCARFLHGTRIRYCRGTTSSFSTM